jgi:hypothetical protein
MATENRELLTYFIKRRPELAGAPPLAALPADEHEANEVILNEFLHFCLHGITGANGVPLRDHLGDMNGTINWLAGYELYDTNFFVARTPAPLFMAVTPEGGSDWSIQCGFMQYVKTGDIAVKLGVNGLVPERIPELENALAAMKPKVEEVSLMDRPLLLAALRGEDLDGKSAPNLKQVLNKLEDKKATGLRELINNRITFLR